MIYMENYYAILKKLYPEYPRQAGKPTRFDIFSFEELKKFIEKYNGKTPVFTSIYNYHSKNRKKVNVNVMVFDFDPSDCNPFEEMTKLSDYCIVNSYKFTTIMSGGGLHFYIFTKEFEKLDNPNMALKNACNAIVKDTGIKTDKTSFGIDRLIRIPGTFNITRKKWCCFLNRKDIEKGWEYIKEFAKNNRFGHFEIIGNEFFNIKNFDKQPMDFKAVEIDDNEKIIIEQSKVLSSVDPCIAHLLLELKNLKHSYRERFIVATNLKDQGLSISEVRNILQDFLPVEKFEHCIRKERQLQHIFEKNTLSLGCKALKEKGFCIDTKGECKTWKK